MVPIEIKETADLSIASLNIVLRGLQAEDLNPLATVYERLTGILQRGQDGEQISVLLREVAGLLIDQANDVAECEASHPGEQCSAGLCALAMWLHPVLLATSAVDWGFELSRGKDM